MNTTPKFKTKKGQLTKYSFACGYVERKEEKGVRKTLWLEGGVYHVRAHDFNQSKRISWDSFHTLKDARAKFSAIKL